MARGYWISFVDVHDPEAYKAYVDENATAFEKYEARFLTRGGTATTVEGQSRSRVVVLEFSDYATALACWNSPEYARARALRASNSVADIVLVEGYEGPQPSHR